MLDFIRRRAQGFFAWLIVGGIIVTFALFGINDYFSGGGDTSVAKVNDQGISQTRLERAYFQQRQRLEDMFGGELPPAFSEKMIKQQVLSQLVAQEVIVQAAVENGMRVSDAQLGEIIRSAEVFQENGKFSRERYEQLLRSQGQSPAAFESMVRRDILAAQFESGYRDTGFVTQADVDSLLRLTLQQRDIGYLQVAMAPFAQAAEVTEEAIEQFYDENAERFRQPEQVKIAYLELSAAELGQDIAVTEDELQARYEAQKINFTTPEERRASHILIQASEDAPEEERAAAREKAEALLARIREGESFAELAKSESDDPGSAEQGGDLGFFTLGAMVPAFEEAAFALGEGEVSGVVESPFGYHIIKLTGIRGGDVKPFAEVKEQLREEIQAERAEERFYDKLEQLNNLTYEHPDSLELASEELGIPVKHTEFFTRQGGTGLAAEPKVMAAAFSEEVLDAGHNSEAIELDRNHMVVLRVSEHQPEQLRPLDEVRETISASLKRRQGREQAVALAEELLARIRAGEAPETLADANADGVTWHEKASLRRDDESVEPSILDHAFAMPQPAEGALSTSSLSLRSGDQAVVVVYGVTEGDPASATEEQRQQARTQLLRAEEAAVAEAVMSGVRGRMDITVKQ